METEWILEIDSDPSPIRRYFKDGDRAWSEYAKVEPVSGWGARLYTRQVTPMKKVGEK